MNLWDMIMRYLNEEEWRKKKMMQMNQRMGPGTPDSYSLQDIFREKNALIEKELGVYPNNTLGKRNQHIEEGMPMRWMMDQPWGFDKPPLY